MSSWNRWLNRGDEMTVLELIDLCGWIARNTKRGWERKFAMSVARSIYDDPSRYPTHRQAYWIRQIGRRVQEERQPVTTTVEMLK